MVRSGVMIQPKVIFGIPFSDIAIGLRKRWIPFKVRMKIVAMLIYMAHGDISKLGINPPARRTHPTLSENLVMNIEYNRITVKPAITNIDGKTLTFADDTQEDFDVLVGATGYKVHLPFVSPELVPVAGNHVDLYKRIFVPRWPGLCFVGMLNPLATLNRIFEEQSKLLVAYIRGEVTLPAPGAMLADIDKKNERSRAIYTDAPRHEMEEPDFGYVEELHAVLRDGSTGAPQGGLPQRLSDQLRRFCWLAAWADAHHWSLRGKPHHRRVAPELEPTSLGASDGGPRTRLVIERIEVLCRRFSVSTRSRASSNE